MKAGYNSPVGIRGVSLDRCDDMSCVTCIGLDEGRVELSPSGEGVTYHILLAVI